MRVSHPVRVGVIGLGFMGRTHIRCYRSAAEFGGSGCENRLIAVADPDPNRLTGRATATGNIATGADDKLFDSATVRSFTNPADLLADPAVELVSICTPTDTHVDLAVAAIKAGKHVLVEKPVAVDPAAVRRLAEAVAASDRLVMPAMCMRFWPGWDWLKDRIADHALGALRTLSFTRLGSGPSWSPEFYRDPRRSGGALFDMHVHDSDFILHCLGRPRAVTSSGSIEMATTIYHYPFPVHVVATGGWVRSPGLPFRIRYTAEFESATADFDHTREHPLMLARNGEWTPVAIPTVSAYDAEIRHMLTAVTAHRHSATPPLRATLADAVAVTDLLWAERHSMETGQTVSL